jgi:hypothetical protein
VREGHGVATAYIGGLSKTETFEDTAKWFEGQLQKHGIPKPIDIYIKDEEYKGRLWARFPTVEVMGTSIALFQSNMITHGDAAEKTWCNKDLPHHMRTSRTFLADFKRLLTVTWKYNKKSVNYDEETMTLSVEGKPIIKVSAQEGHMDLKWLEVEWQEWKDVVEAAEFIEIVKKGDVALKVAKELRASSKGKGNASS